MYLIPSLKLIYLAQPRTGSTSLAGWLNRNGLSEMVNGRPSFPPSWGDHHGIDPVILKEKRDAEWKAFTFVRNHWDYAVSFYFEHHRRGDITFENFLTGEFPEMAWHTVVPRFGWEWNTKGSLFWLLPRCADYVLKYEGFPANLVPFFGEEILQLENVNPSPRKCYEAYYTDATRAWVQRRYWREIEQYHYTYGENDGKEEGREVDTYAVRRVAGHDGRGALEVHPVDPERLQGLL